MIPRLAITTGDPAGIGPDIVLHVAQQAQRAELVVFADANLLRDRAMQLRTPLQLIPFEVAHPPTLLPAQTLCVAHTALNHPVTAGQGSSSHASYILETLTAATNACLQHHCDALVTGPVNKGLIHEAGFKFSGHTEFLAQLTHSDQVVMMLMTEGLRVALATTHLPLKAVPAAITPERLEQVITVIHDNLSRYFCHQPPRILVCGLNPHAGDGGALGTEERDIIIPVLEKLRRQQINVSGPYAADTVFTPKHLANADIVLAMYHDQGLPVLKYKGFNRAINVTLGLNIVRTSVDHGTAYDIAGTGKADAESLQLAIDTAIAMCTQQHLQSQPP